MGITGQDTILESNTQDGVTELLKLGFGGCKLQVQVPEKGPIHSIEQLAGKRIVSSYTTLARDYFRQLDLRLGLIKTDEKTGEEVGQGTRVEYVGGSVEAACALGLADGIGMHLSHFKVNSLIIARQSTSSSRAKPCAQPDCTPFLPS